MKKLFLLISIAFSILIFTSCHPNITTSDKMEIHIIDVGQGDAILIKTPENQYTLIDTGPYKSYDKLKAYLLGLRITEFDKVIATHPDSDHIGSMAEILEEFKVNEFYMPAKEHSTKSFELMNKVLKEKNIPFSNPYSGDEIILSHTVKGSFLSPQKQVYDENNLYSLVLYIEHGKNSFLFMGDVEAENEYDILSEYPLLETDFIKLGHHGSDSSTTRDFIKQVNPYIAAISVGRANSFGHPHQNVVDILESMGIPLYRTDEQGSLVFLSDGKKIYSNQQNPGSYKAGTN